MLIESDLWPLCEETDCPTDAIVNAGTEDDPLCLCGYHGMYALVIATVDKKGNRKVWLDKTDEIDWLTDGKDA